jgi:hypothetical protein
MEGEFDLRLITEETTHLVLSDFNNHKHGDQWVFTKFKAFFGGQKLISMTDKYCAKRTFKWGKPLIYLCNSFPEKWLEDDWLKANMIHVVLDKPLF